MHPRLTELMEYAGRQRETLLGTVGTIPERLRDRRLDPGCWSAGEVLEHLYRVELGIARLITRSLERAKALGLEAEHEVGSVMSSLDELHLTDRRQRITAPDPVVPTGDLSAADAMAGLGESRRALFAALSAGDGLALSQITYPHPLMGPLNLYQWVLFIGQHEARHTAQLEELARRAESWV